MAPPTHTHTSYTGLLAMNAFPIVIFIGLSPPAVKMTPAYDNLTIYASFSYRLPFLYPRLAIWNSLDLWKVTVIRVKLLLTLSPTREEVEVKL
jgi:hypothetical protein